MKFYTRMYTISVLCKPDPNYKSRELKCIIFAYNGVEKSVLYLLYI
jgi:hypothetical protein